MCFFCDDVQYVRFSVSIVHRLSNDLINELSNVKAFVDSVLIIEYTKFIVLIVVVNAFEVHRSHHQKPSEVIVHSQ